MFHISRDDSSKEVLNLSIDILKRNSLGSARDKSESYDEKNLPLNGNTMTFQEQEKTFYLIEIFYSDPLLFEI